MNEMNITSVTRVSGTNDFGSEYESFKATIDGQELSVPSCEGNRHYDEIMRQVDAGTLTITEAE